MTLIRITPDGEWTAEADYPDDSEGTYYDDYLEVDVDLYSHMCDTCKFEMPKCDELQPTFGINMGYDNIIHCHKYQYEPLPEEKSRLYDENKYSFEPPPVWHGNWCKRVWMDYIDKHGRWFPDKED